MRSLDKRSRQQSVLEALAAQASDRIDGVTADALLTRILQGMRRGLPAARTALESGDFKAVDEELHCISASLANAGAKWLRDSMTEFRNKRLFETAGSDLRRDAEVVCEQAEAFQLELHELLDRFGNHSEHRAC